MDLTLLSKKISSYRTPKGRVTKLPDEILGEILNAWEQWPGTAADFYRALGSHQKKMAKLMGKAKQLKRDGAFDGLNFTEVVIEDSKLAGGASKTSADCQGIEVVWDKHMVIKFGNSDLLLDFLKKAA